MGADGAWRLSQPDSSGRARKGQASEHVVLARGSRRLELRGPGARPRARGSLAALRILQPLPQPAPSLQPPSAMGRTRGSPPSFRVHVFPVSPGILSVWRSLLHYYSQWSFLGSLDGAHLSVSFCLPLSQMLLPVWGWGGWSQSRAGGDAWARGLAREGRCGAWDGWLARLGWSLPRPPGVLSTAGPLPSVLVICENLRLNFSY